MYSVYNNAHIMYIAYIHVHVLHPIFCKHLYRHNVPTCIYAKHTVWLLHDVHMHVHVYVYTPYYYVMECIQSQHLHF